MPQRKVRDKKGAQGTPSPKIIIPLSWNKIWGEEGGGGEGESNAPREGTTKCHIVGLSVRRVKNIHR